MTLKEAKKILKKEGYDLVKVGRPCSPSIAITAYESPKICEAMQVVCSAGYGISMVSSRFDDRKARLSLELAENSAPIEEQPKEKKGIIYPTTFPKADFYYKHVLNEGNPALKEAASQFNDALLDEQAKKIEKLAKEKERLKDQIAVLDACKKHNEKIDRKQIKYLGKEIARLNGIIHDKNEEIKRKTKGCCELVTENVDLKKKLSDKDAVLSDVAEELRLSKIREKNLTEVCQKYMKENKELWATLADNVVDKIDAQALKSAESALAYKEKVIAEKDEVIAELTHELKAKHKKYVWYKGAYEAAQQILNTIADYAAKHPDKKFSDQMVQDSHVECGTKVLVDKSVFEQIMKKAYGK